MGVIWRISSNNSSNEVTNMGIIISININITIDTTGITTGTGIAINTGEILRKGLVQSLQLHRQGRRTSGEGGGYIQRLSPSGSCMLCTHTHTHTTTRRSCLLGFSIELATYKT